MPTTANFGCVATAGGKAPSSIAFKVTGENKHSYHMKDKLEKEGKEVYSKYIALFPDPSHQSCHGNSTSGVFPWVKRSPK